MPALHVTSAVNLLNTCLGPSGPLRFRLTMKRESFLGKATPHVEAGDSLIFSKAHVSSRVWCFFSLQGSEALHVLEIRAVSLPDEHPFAP